MYLATPCVLTAKLQLYFLLVSAPVITELFFVSNTVLTAAVGMSMSNQTSLWLELKVSREELHRC